MTKDLLHSLSKSLEQLYKTGEDYNVIIEVGKDLNDVKNFKAHSSILRARSIYFKSALSNNWATIKNNIIYFNKPNVSPLIFDIILHYIYTGNIIIEDDYNITQFIDLMIAADEMDLEEIITHVQRHILGNGFIRKDFILLYKVFVKMHSSPHFKKLKNEIISTLHYDPQILFNMNDVHILEEFSLTSLIKSDHINMLEYDIWKRVLKWGISRTSIGSRGFDTWTKEEFIKLKEELRNVLPLIKFQEMSLKQFKEDSIIISNLIPEKFNNLLIEFPSTPIDSVIITEKNAANFSNMIDHYDNRIEDSYSPKENPYKFNLIFRQNKGSLNFLELTKLENINNTLIICKLDKKFEIIGGFYPRCWKVEEVNGRRKLTLEKCFTKRFTNRNYQIASRLSIFRTKTDALWEFNLNNNKIVITVKSILKSRLEIVPESLEIFKLEKTNKCIIANTNVGM